MSLIIKNISKHIALTPEEKLLFLSKTETRHYKVKTIILNSGEICKHSYFVNSGLLRSFNINDHIVEHVLGFACEGWWIGDMYSLLSQKTRQSFHRSARRCRSRIAFERKSRNFISRNSKTRTLFQNPNREFFGCTSGTLDG